MSAAYTLGNVAGVVAVGAEEAVLTAELQAGSEEAFALLISQYHASVYSLVSRVLNDPSDAPDITQDVFIKVFRGIRSFHGDSSLRTWIYRIALREASNQRRWWSRHRGREVTIEEQPGHGSEGESFSLKDMLVDEQASPFEHAVHDEIREQVELQLRRLPEHFRTVVVLRDLEGMSYEEIADILGMHLGTVKSRLVRGRAMLRARLGNLIDPAAGRRDAASTRNATKEAVPNNFEEAV
jgi:RNA polymerase sigma-70 factor, ECF subfamily